MFAGELKAATNKLQREQAQRTERERQRQEKERVLKERQRARQAAREEEGRQRRLQAAAAAAAEEERRAEELEANRGVFLHLDLAASPSDSAAAAARGIKRTADKLVLPASAGASLLAQDASKNGTMLFQVASENGGVTHAAVLEFTAPPGVALLPRKVVNSLWGLPESGLQQQQQQHGPEQQQQQQQQQPWPDQQQQVDTDAAGPGPGSSSSRCSGRVFIRYRLLPKGSYVRFQPETRAFHEVVGADPDVLRAALEGCLMGYTTLTEGDWCEVEHEGQVYNLRVLELQPEPAVSIVDTEMAADIGPSIETEGYIRAKEEAEAREAERQRQAQAAADKAAAEAAAAEAAAAEAEQQRAAEEAARRLQLQADKAALVAPEVAADSPEPHVSLLFRLPDGSRLPRRFRLVQQVVELFDFLDSQGAGGLWPGTYCLGLQYPRRVLDQRADGATSLHEAGFEAGSQQAVFVEPSAGGGTSE